MHTHWHLCKKMRQKKHTHISIKGLPVAVLLASVVGVISAEIVEIPISKNTLSNVSFAKSLGSAKITTHISSVV